ncbi:MAG: RNA-binding ATPase activator esf2 [Bathelium mastoideum]|nr:MAG: RNA-binding ATPase activator esf2 [Bathelium mastoideum]
MPSRDHNDWLNASQSEEDSDRGYDSDREQDSKDAAFRPRSSKRRKLNDDIEDESLASDDEGQDSSGNPINELPRKQEKDGSASSNAAEENGFSPSKSLPPENQIPSSLTSKKLKASRKKIKKTGVIYLTRIPPFMKPATVKHLLQPYGEIGRIFLTPEDPEAHTRRVKAGGNKKRSFVDGWVEFLSKKDAKVAAETLNATIIGGKKGGWYHDDVWNMKYLRGFKWNHLTEQIANENAERAARLRAEIAQTTRESKAFLQNVERAKMLEGMEAKKNRKRGGLDLDTMESDRGTSDPPRIGNAKAVKRDFLQNEVMLKNVKDSHKEETPDHVKRILGKIF